MPLTDHEKQRVAELLQMLSTKLTMQAQAQRSADDARELHDEAAEAHSLAVRVMQCPD